MNERHTYGFIDRVTLGKCSSTVFLKSIERAFPLPQLILIRVYSLERVVNSRVWKFRRTFVREYFIYFINETQVYMGLNMYPSGRFMFPRM